MESIEDGTCELVRNTKVCTVILYGKGNFDSTLILNNKYIINNEKTGIVWEYVCFNHQFKKIIYIKALIMYFFVENLHLLLFLNKLFNIEILLYTNLVFDSPTTIFTMIHKLCSFSYRINQNTETKNIFNTNYK